MKHFVGLLLIVGTLLFTQDKLFAQGFCVSSNIQKELFDTSSSFIIKGHIKDPACIRTATLAVANNLRVLLVHTDATIFKFKFAGFHRLYPQIPQYYIVMSNGLYLSRLNILTGDVALAPFSNQQSQKWILKKNGNGTYSILVDEYENGHSCFVLGRPSTGDPFTLNSQLKTTGPFIEGDRYQQFWLTKLQ